MRPANSFFARRSCFFCNSSTTDAATTRFASPLVSARSSVRDFPPASEGTACREYAGFFSFRKRQESTKEGTLKYDDDRRARKEGRSAKRRRHAREHAVDSGSREDGNSVCCRARCNDNVAFGVAAYTTLRFYISMCRCIVIVIILRRRCNCPGPVRHTIGAYPRLTWSGARSIFFSFRERAEKAVAVAACYPFFLRRVACVIWGWGPEQWRRRRFVTFFSSVLVLGHFWILKPMFWRVVKLPKGRRLVVRNVVGNALPKFISFITTYEYLRPVLIAQIEKTLLL